MAVPATATQGIATAVNSGVSSTTSRTSIEAPGGVTPSEEGGWWHNHWKWVVMLIAMFIGFGIFAVVMVLVRRWWHRRQDRNDRPFNAGITTRTTQEMVTEPHLQHYGPATCNVEWPSSHGSTPHLHNHKKTYLPRVRERDQTAMLGASGLHDIERNPLATRGDTVRESARGSRGQLTLGNASLVRADQER